jgi:hypothetical protein
LWAKDQMNLKLKSKKQSLEIKCQYWERIEEEIFKKNEKVVLKCSCGSRKSEALWIERGRNSWEKSPIQEYFENSQVDIETLWEKSAWNRIFRSICSDYRNVQRNSLGARDGRKAIFYEYWTNKVSRMKVSRDPTFPIRFRRQVERIDLSRFW